MIRRRKSSIFSRMTFDEHFAMNICGRRYRFTDCVAATCISASLILCCYISMLSRDLEQISAYMTAIEEDGTIEGSFSKENSSDAHFLPLPIDETLSKRIIVAPPLNNTGRGRQDVLILTKIPRSGLTNLRRILTELKKRNKFQVVMPHLKPEEVISIPSEEVRENLVNKVNSLNDTSVIIDSFSFVDFTKYGQEQPIQVSFVRDPVERAISSYYFARAPYNVVERFQIFNEDKLPSMKFLKKSMESCLENEKDEECWFDTDTNRPGNTLHYFCGHEDFCRLFGNAEAFENAVGVVKKNFAVVGLVEELEKTLIVLEHYVPRFFKGAYDVYQELKANGMEKEMKNRNMYKPSLNKYFRSTLETKFEVENEFYSFLRNRLHEQYQKIVERTLINKRLSENSNIV